MCVCITRTCSHTLTDMHTYRNIYISYLSYFIYVYIQKNTLCDEAGHSDAKLAAFGVPQGGSNSLDRFLIRIRGAGPKWFILGLRGSVVTSRRVANVS